MTETEDRADPAPRPARPATIYDVAAAAGVSTQTVHRYTKGFEGISATTRAKVERAMAELSYRPDPVARALRTRTPTKILLLVHGLDQVFPSSIVRAASSAARRQGYQLEIVDLDAGDAPGTRAVLEQLDLAWVAGALALAPTPELSDVFATFPFRFPVLREVQGDGLMGEVDQGPVDPGTELVVEHLHALGHRELGVVAGPEGWYSAQRRLTTAVQRAEELGMRVAFVEHGDWSARSGHRIASGLARRTVPTAVLCGNDHMALGVVSAFADVGIEVPRDVSVTGFDDIGTAAYFRPPLTTVHQDFRTAGEIAVHRLLAMIRAGEPDATTAVPAGPEPVRVPPRLVVRRSTAVPRTTD